MADAMYEIEGITYTPGQGAETLYLFAGATTDWTQEAGIPLNYLFELRDTGEFGFVLPPDQIIPNGREMLAAMNELYLHIIAKENQ